MPREADSHGTTLLSDIKAVFDERAGEWADRMFSEMLAEALAAIEGSKWSEYGKARKPITKNQLAQLLKDFKIGPAGTVKIGTKSLKGYYRHQFEEAWERYLTPTSSQGVDETSPRHPPTAAGTSSQFSNVTTPVTEANGYVTDPGLSVTGDVSKCEKPPSNGHGDVVTFHTGVPMRVCVQCGGEDDGALEQHQCSKSRSGLVWLHPECVRFYPKG